MGSGIERIRDRVVWHLECLNHTEMILTQIVETIIPQVQKTLQHLFLWSLMFVISLRAVEICYP